MSAGVACSFCGTSIDEVKRMVAGPAVHICDACILLCVGILEEEAPLEGWRAGSRQRHAVDGRPVFVPKPAARILVRFPDGSVHACEQRSAWRPLENGAERYEWCRAVGVVRSSALLPVVAVRNEGTDGPIRGVALPEGTRIDETHAQRLLGDATE